MLTIAQAIQERREKEVDRLKRKISSIEAFVMFQDKHIKKLARKNKELRERNEDLNRRLNEIITEQLRGNVSSW